MLHPRIGLQDHPHKLIRVVLPCKHNLQQQQSKHIWYKLWPAIFSYSRNTLVLQLAILTTLHTQAACSAEYSIGYWKAQASEAKADSRPSEGKHAWNCSWQHPACGCVGMLLVHKEQLLTTPPCRQSGMALQKCFTHSHRCFVSNLGAKVMRSGLHISSNNCQAHQLAAAMGMTLCQSCSLQAGDLKRLLELYVSWQQRILPFSTFDAFLEALEKLGSSYVLKVTNNYLQFWLQLGLHPLVQSTACIVVTRGTCVTYCMCLQMELRELRSGVLKVMEEPKHVSCLCLLPNYPVR